MKKPLMCMQDLWNIRAKIHHYLISNYVYLHMIYMPHMLYVLVMGYVLVTVHGTGANFN